MEAICHQSERADSITADDLDEEENNIDSQKDDNLGLIIQPHVSVLGGKQEAVQKESAAIATHHARINFYYFYFFLRQHFSHKKAPTRPTAMCAAKTCNVVPCAEVVLGVWQDILLGPYIAIPRECMDTR